MSERFDFHTHTVASDGALTPTELVRAAVWAGSDTCTRAGAQPPYLTEVPHSPSGSAGSRL